MDNSDVLRRLNTIEGHVRGVERMVEQGTYCVDIIRQIHAVQSALSRVSMQILDNHLNSCVITAIRGENPDEREKVLKEITELFSTAEKI